MRLVYDIETNGLLPELHTVHCACVKDVDTGQEWNFVNKKYRAPSDGTIEDFLALLDQADLAIGHNIITFDYPALTKVYDYPEPDVDKVYDTYVRSMVTYPALPLDDFTRNKWRVARGKPPLTTGYLVGSHTLKAWGNRLGIHKGNYGDNRKDWSVFDMDMLRYCMQDVRVNAALFLKLEETPVDPGVFRTEQRFAYIMHKQQEHGFLFDVEKAEALVCELQKEQAKAHAKLDTLFPPREVVTFTKVKRLRRVKMIPFNPGSRDQIAWNLTNKYGWVPNENEYTKGGKPRVDDAILGALDYPEAKLLAHSLMVGKRLGALAEGKGAWLKKLGEDGRMHGRVVNVGTPHGRCAHSNPNMAQVASPKKPYGKECRELFTSPDGKAIVGCDAKGIQLRALAHYLARFDGGAYIDLVLSGDPHAANQAAAGIDTRDEAKRFIYAFLFGGGDKMIGGIVGGGKVKGKATKERFFAKMPGVRDLVDSIEHSLRMSKGRLRGLDGRVVPVDKMHTGLNYLLTSFEAAIMKLATVILHDELAPAAGLVFGEHYANVAHVHDEFQFECDTDKAVTLGECAQRAIQLAGERLGSRCPLDGEYKIGETWFDTH